MFDDFDKNEYKICRVQKNRKQLQKADRLMYECYCEKTTKTLRLLLIHFRRKHLQQKPQDSVDKKNIKNQYYFIYYKHPQKYIYLVKLYHISSIQSDQSLNPYLNKYFTQSIDQKLQSVRPYSLQTQLSPIPQGYYQLSLQKIKQLNITGYSNQKKTKIKFHCICGNNYALKQLLIYHFRKDCRHKYSKHDQMIYLKYFKHQQINVYFVQTYSEQMIVDHRFSIVNTEEVNLKQIKPKPQIMHKLLHYQDPLQDYVQIQQAQLEAPKNKLKSQIQYKCMCHSTYKQKICLIKHLKRSYASKDFSEDKVYLRYFKLTNQNKILVRPYFKQMLSNQQFTKLQHYGINLKLQRIFAKRQYVQTNSKSSVPYKSSLLKVQSLLQCFSPTNSKLLDFPLPQSTPCCIFQCYCGILFRTKRKLVKHMRYVCKCIDRREKMYLRYIKNLDEDKFLIRTVSEHQVQDGDQLYKEEINLITEKYLRLLKDKQKGHIKQLKQELVKRQVQSQFNQQDGQQYHQDDQDGQSPKWQGEISIKQEYQKISNLSDFIKEQYNQLLK